MKQATDNKIPVTGTTFQGPGGIGLDPGLFDLTRKAERLEEELSSLTLPKVHILKGALAEKYGLKPGEIVQCFKDIKDREDGGDGGDGKEDLDPMAHDPEPWPEDVDLFGLVTEVREILKRHVLFKDEFQPVACALWIVATWFVDQFDYAPYLMVSSPLKRCGKSTLMLLISRLVRKPMVGALMSAAAVYRMLESQQRTLIIDEADNFLRADPLFQDILLCGIERDGVATLAWKCDKNSRNEIAVRPYSCFAFKAIAGIKAEWMKGTLTDRAIVITLRRRTKNDPATLGRKETEAERFDEIRRKLCKASIQWADRVRNASPAMTVTDREEEKWTPLLKIADAVRDDDPASPRSGLGTYARKCAEKLLFDSSTAISASGEDLLRCLVELRRRRPYDGPTIHQKTLLNQLLLEDDWEWRNANHGRGLTPRGLTEMLASFDVRPRQCKIQGENRNGYRWEDIFRACEVYGLDTTLSRDEDEDENEVRVE